MPACCRRPYWQITQNYDAILAPVETLLTSELSTLDGFKALDPEKFLASTGGRIIEQVAALSAAMGGKTLEQMKQEAQAIKVTVASNEGGSAKLVIEAEGQPPIEQELRLVDGKWLPAQLADGWTEKMAQAKAGLAAAPPPDQSKAQAMAMMGMVEGVVDQLLAADTADKFNQVIGTIMTLAGGLMGGAGAAPPVQ